MQSVNQILIVFLGVKNGMFMGAALKLCPDLKTIPYDFEGYEEVAKTLYDTVARYTLDIQVQWVMDIWITENILLYVAVLLIRHDAVMNIYSTS